MSELVPPHGNKNLKPLALEDDALTTELEKASINLLSGKLVY